MKTTATNRKVRTLITAIRKGDLIPKPEFQRRLVWTYKDKRRFLETVLKGFPFPEIYIAAGEVDHVTAEGKELLVDGQQRITTLVQYFSNSEDLNLGKEIPPYSELTPQEKENFLEYDVVIRDLGKLDMEDIKEVFERINATKYSLNDMEIHNARFAGEFKSFAEKISQDSFFEMHRIFSANEIRRMSDVSFAVTFIITIMSTYFNRDDVFEEYLENYNDDFPMKTELEEKISVEFKVINDCNFPDKCRIWKKSDLLSILVELYKALFINRLHINPSKLSSKLLEFYQLVDDVSYGKPNPKITREIEDYAKDASQATNDRGSRVRRGETIQKIIINSQ